MTKEKIIELLNNPRKLLNANLSDLEQLAEKHPYCYVFHALIAKAYHDLEVPEYEKKLHQAALLSTNRKQLKVFMGLNTTKEGDVAMPEVKKADEQQVSLNEEVEEFSATQHQVGIVNEEAVRAEAVEERDADHQSIDEFLESATQKESDTEKLYKELEENMRVLKDRMQQVNSEVTLPEFPEVTVKEEEIISELETKQKTTQEYLDEKQKLQYELIEKFIEDQPRLARKEPSQHIREDSEDLSAPSSVISDDLVSENLAVIMIRQGKNDSAIDIYKKLIWKFPQKKAYFADRIKELKKNN